MNIKKKKKLRIAIDCFPLSDNQYTGIPNTILNLLTELQRIDKENEYYLLFKNSNNRLKIINENWKIMLRYKFKNYLKIFFEKNPCFLNKKIVSLLMIILGLFSFFYHQITLPFWLMFRKIDIFVQMSTDLPLPLFTYKTKTILFIYDLVWHLYPETMDKQNRLRTKIFIYRNIKKADILVTISESVKQDLVKYLNIKKPIYVIYLAASEKFFKQSFNKILDIKNKYGIKGKYILSVSTLEPRKNLDKLIDAFLKLKKTDIFLVLTGKFGWDFDNIVNKINYCNNNKIITTGYLPLEDLVALYSGAEIFVFPSIYEGFGLPILEAMKCGCPIITSKFSSLPEVTAGNALLIDTNNVDEIVRAIDLLLGNNDLRKKLISNGMQRANDFSWEKTAHKFKQLLKLL